MSGTTTNFAWTFPTGGDVPNVASDMQTIAAAIDASLGNAFTVYTPVWSSTGTAPVIGNGTFAARFKRFGKWGLCFINMTLGTTSTVGTGLYRWTLPAGWTLQNANLIYGAGGMLDSSAGSFFAGAVWASSTTLITIRTHSATSEVGATVPVVPATGDIYQFQIVAELT